MIRPIDPLIQLLRTSWEEFERDHARYFAAAMVYYLLVSVVPLLLVLLAVLGLMLRFSTYAAAAEQQGSGRELVPLLAARTEEVQRRADEWFPEVHTRAVRSGADAEGWHAGRAAADRAHLGTGDEIASA